MKTYEKICKTCNKEFTCNRSHKSFCSRLCYRRDPTIRITYSKAIAEYQKAHAKEPSRRFDKLKFKCKHEKRLLTISKKEFIELINKPCTYCQKSLLDETGCGLDRLNNNKDYELTNVVPCCGNCNKIRNNYLSHEEMKVAMAAVLTLRGKA